MADYTLTLPIAKMRNLERNSQPGFRVAKSQDRTHLGQPSGMAWVVGVKGAEVMGRKSESADVGVKGGAGWDVERTTSVA